MKIANAWSMAADATEAANAAYTQLEQKLKGRPDWLAVYASVKYDSASLMNTLSEMASDVPIHGGTSCLGIMTEAGFHSSEGLGLGLLGIKDPDGVYGVGATDGSPDPREDGSVAVREALAAADHPNEAPKLLWLTCAPGAEEDVLCGIEDVVGSNVPIAGGSAADNTIEGHWRQFANGQVHHNGVVVTAMYPSTKMHHAFHSGYLGTQHIGTVTGASGRTIYTIDAKPAAQVYNEWTGGAIQDFLDGGNVLGATTLYPIGRVARKIGAVTHYRLSHPETVTPEGGLTLFTNIQQGDRVVLMTGSRQSLVTRAGQVVRSALRNGRLNPNQVAGGLIIYCAGCMLTVQDQMHQVATNIRDALRGAPFLGVFTFGEQGCFVGGANYHGNLMISAVVFERS